MADEKTTSDTIRELIDATKAQTHAENRTADEQNAKNRLEASRQQQEVTRQRDDAARMAQFDRMLSVIQHCDADHQRPMMVILMDIRHQTEILLRLNQVIASRVIGEDETNQLIEAMSRMAKKGEIIRMEVGNQRVDFANVGDVTTGDIAGGAIKK
jgi:hypothetical protein